MHQPRIAQLVAYTLLLSLSLFLANCGGKDDTVAPNSVEGNWKILSIKLNPGLDVPPLGKVTDLLTAYGLLRNTTCLTDVLFTFKSDGTLVSSNPASCQTNVAEIKVQTGIDFAGTSKWSLTGDQLTITAADNTKLTVTSTVANGSMVWTYKRALVDLNGVSSNQDVRFELRKA